MTATITGGNPVISAWSTVSPAGLSGAEFTEGMRSGKETAVRLDPERWQVPFEKAHLVPDFDIRTVLGRRGTRSMDRATGLAVTVVGDLLTGHDGERLPGVDENTGLVLGTSIGSAQSMMDFTRDSLVGERPYLVDPARFPNTVMNCAAGQSAIWHRLRGPNTTIAGGRATGLLALQYALRLQRAGRAETLLCGAVEEFSTARAWLDWHATEHRDRLLGEGAAVWLLERADAVTANGRHGMAEVLGLEFGFAQDSSEIRPVLQAGLRRLLDRSGVAADEVWAVAGSQTRAADDDAERAAVAEMLGGATPRYLSCAELVGDTCAASSAFQIVAALALAEGDGDSGGRTVLVTSTEPNGVVGAALLKLVDHREAR